MAAGDLRHIRGDSRRLDRANIRAALEGSLRRLKTDHVDLYQVHWPERAVTTDGRARFSLVADAPGQVAIEETRAALGMMDRGGHIINVTSESVDAPYPHHVVYQATKGGVEVMSRHLQDEVRPRGIRVSVVRAGPMYGEDRTMEQTPSVLAFYAACVERGIDLRKNPISEFSSVYWIFRSLIDMPADIHVDTVRFGARHP